MSCKSFKCAFQLPANFLQHIFGQMRPTDYLTSQQQPLEGQPAPAGLSLCPQARLSCPCSMPTAFKAFGHTESTTNWAGGSLPYAHGQELLLAALPA